MRKGLLVVLAAVLALAGCSAIPTAGTVQNGPTQAPDDPRVIIVPPPPANGADQQAIVSGFIQAASSPDRGFRIAKQYLTPAFAKRWNPSTRVFVHDQSWSTADAGPGRVDLALPLSARVDTGGRYTPASRRISLHFALVKVGGQWRISQADDGIVLAQDVFQRTYQPEWLQYFDQTFARSVPDLRWFPARVTQAGPIVRALVAGRSAPIGAGVAVSAFPTGTVVGSVGTDDDGDVTVAISIPGDPPAPQVTERMQQQLARSLQLRTSSIRLLVDGRQAPPARTLPVPASQSRVFALADGRFGLLSQSGTVADDPVLGRKVASTKPIAVTVSPRQRLAAVLTDQGVDLVDAQRVRPLDRRTGLVRPTLDQRGWTYTATSDGSQSLEAYFARGRHVVLQGRLGSGQVTAIEASPDGSRMLVLLEGTGGPSAYVAGIEREADGTPVALTDDRYPIPVTAEAAVDATWLDDKNVAVLVSGADSQSVAAQQVGGLSSSLGPLPAAATAIVGAGSPEELRALIASDLYVRTNNVWQPEFSTPLELSVLAVQR